MRNWPLIALILIACGGEDFEAKEPVCDPGKTAECMCAGEHGSQVCADDGMKWGKCECGGASSGGSGGSVGTSGSSAGGSGGSGGSAGEPVVVRVGEECDGAQTICGALAECHGTCLSALGGECFFSLHCLGGLSCAETLRCTDREVIPLGGVCGGSDLCEAPSECWLLDGDDEAHCVVR